MFLCVVRDLGSWVLSLEFVLVVVCIVIPGQSGPGLQQSNLCLDNEQRWGLHCMPIIYEYLSPFLSFPPFYLFFRGGLVVLTPGRPGGFDPGTGVKFSWLGYSSGLQLVFILSQLLRLPGGWGTVV